MSNLYMIVPRFGTFCRAWSTSRQHEGNMGQQNVTEIAGGLVNTIGKEGTFCVGALFGAGLALLFGYMAGSERKMTMKLLVEREKALQDQISVKEQRIDALHSEIEKFKRRKGQ